MEQGYRKAGQLDRKNNLESGERRGNMRVVKKADYSIHEIAAPTIRYSFNCRNFTPKMEHFAP